MKILILPGLFRQMLNTVCILAPIFFIALISYSQLVINDASYFNLLRIAVLSVFMAIHYWWFIAANDQDIQRERFLVSLPLSRLRVARLSLQIMLASQSIVVGVIFIVCFIFLVFTLVDSKQVFIIATYCLWFPLIILLAYCVLGYIRFWLFRLLIGMLTLIIPMASLLGLFEHGLNPVVIVTAMAVPLILGIISLVIIRHSERRFLQMDLL